ncbi:hypothetical protein ACNR9Q_00330 [Maribacter sp. X9]|uniref:hypothetical protein n=1 Tax=Maribacter sp. X9 TaxID=3402159 RepID=UPI003AF3A9F3
MKDVVFLNEKQDAEIKRSRLKLKDVLLTITGVSYGKSSTVNAELEGANINQHSVKITLNEGLNPYFLSTFFNSKHGKLQSDKNIVGVTRPALDYNVIRNFHIPNISNDFQKKIELLILKFEGLNNKSKQEYSSAKETLLKEISLDDFESIQTNNFQEISLTKSLITTTRLDAEYYHPKPLFLIDQLKKKEYYLVKELFDIGNGYPWKSKYFKEQGKGEPFVRIRNCKPGYIDNETLTTLDSDYAKAEKVEKAKANDIVIGMDGIKYFYGSLIKESVYINQRVCHLTPKENSEMDSELVLMIINSVIGQTQLMREMTIAQTVGHITNVSVGNLIIPKLDDKIRNEVSEKIKKSHQFEKESLHLLEVAKKAVEIAIEENEEVALHYITRQTKNLN